MKITTAYALIWIAVSVGVSVGIIVTKSLAPLWTFIIPALIRVNSEGE